MNCKPEAITTLLDVDTHCNSTIGEPTFEFHYLIASFQLLTYIGLSALDGHNQVQEPLVVPGELAVVVVEPLLKVEVGVVEVALAVTESGAEDGLVGGTLEGEGDVLSRAGEVGIAPLEAAWIGISSSVMVLIEEVDSSTKETMYHCCCRYAG